jgi:hypothetical protein
LDTEPVDSGRLGLKAETVDEGTLTAHPQTINKAAIARNLKRHAPQ